MSGYRSEANNGSISVPSFQSPAISMHVDKLEIIYHLTSNPTLKTPTHRQLERAFIRELGSAVCPQRSDRQCGEPFQRRIQEC